ncbi:hypothetical protein NPS46_15385 [Pseudomonas putida]|uniref:hypothetical protein n=1 Tax=Pseudomonas putida TaxID=303 RepID=UPI00236407B5|nr:hypothetical protein [Pseudomonas putida]MDD2053933.1 hypothetical protein [Pseudomonas putida]
MTVAIALASRLQRMDCHTRGPTAHAVDMDAETLGIERTGVVFEIFGLIVVLDKAAGGGDPHFQQAQLLHLHKLLTDKVVAAGILGIDLAVEVHRGLGVWLQPDIAASRAKEESAKCCFNFNRIYPPE